MKKSNILFIGIILLALLIFAGCEEGEKKQGNSPIDSNKEIDFTNNEDEVWEDIYIIKEGNKYGFINNTGEVVIEPQFEDSDYITYNKNSISSDDNVYNSNGIINLDKNYDSIGNYYEGLAPVANFYEALDPMEYNAKCGYINQKGEIEIPLKFNESGHFHEGLARINETLEKVMFIDVKGNIVIEITKDDIKNKLKEDIDMFGVGDFSDGLAMVWGHPAESDIYEILRYGYIDKTGNYVIPPLLEYTYLPPEYENLWFYEGLAVSRAGYIDKEGNLVIECDYDHIFPFRSGVAVVMTEDKWGLIDKEGNEIIPLKYEKIKTFSEGLGAVYINGKWGFIDKDDNLIIQPRFKRVGYFREGIVQVIENGEIGYVNRNGDYIWGHSDEIKNLFDEPFIFDPHSYDSHKTNKRIF